MSRFYASARIEGVSNLWVERLVFDAVLSVLSSRSNAIEGPLPPAASNAQRDAPKRAPTPKTKPLGLESTD